MYRLFKFKAAEEERGFAFNNLDNQGNCYSVLIGPNGTGKSQLLGDVARDKIRIAKEGVSRPGEETHPPERVLALSNLVTDRFPYRRGREGMYRYLGLKQTTNAMYSGAVASSLGTFWVEFKTDQRNELDLEPVFSYLNMPEFTLRVTSLAQHDTTRAEKKLYQYAKFSMPDWSTSALTKLSNQMRMFASEAESVSIETINDFTRNQSISGTQAIDLLRRVHGVRFELDFGGYDPSAGQALLLSMLLRIASAITPDSLVLIDEPEVGLHPKWQSGFLGLLRSFIPEDFGCHFIIATHSPYLALDAANLLVPSKSKRFEQLSIQHQGLSLEDIIYRVFETRVLGSAAVEKDLVKVLDWLSDPGKHESEGLYLAITSLKGIANEGTTTLNRVLEQAEKKLRVAQ